MPKTLLLALTLLVSAAWVQAQSNAGQNSGQNGYGGTAGSGQTTQSTAGQGTASEGTSGHSGQHASGQMKVEGCLSGSEGNYTLTDNSGVTYQLQGDTSKLAKHVGHEVEITGSTSGAGTSASSGMSGGSASGGSQQTLTVSHMKHISASCKNKGMSK